MAKRGLLCIGLVLCLHAGTALAAVDYDSGTIAGTVTTTNGTIAQQVRVRATPTITVFPMSADAPVDSSGHYELDFMPVGEYRLDVLYENTQVGTATVTVAKAATTARSFTFAAGYISVHVTRNGSNDVNATVFLQNADPAPTCTTPGASCNALPPDMCDCTLDGRRYFCDGMGCHWQDSAFYQLSTDANGIARKLVPAGIYNAAVGSSNPPMGMPDPMFPMMSQSGFIFVGTANSVSVADGADVLAGTFAYETATITGTISAGGAPLTNVTVRADAGGQSGSITAWVNSAGAYTMQLPTLASYTISALQDGSSVIGSTSNVTLAAQETRTIDFGIPGALVSGDVLADGQPGANAAVFFQKHAPESCDVADSCEINDPNMGYCRCTLGGDRYTCMGSPMGGDMCMWEQGGFSSTFTNPAGHFEKFLAPGTYDLAVMSAQIMGDPMHMMFQFGQLIVGRATTTITAGTNVSLGTFSYTTGTVSGAATSCGGPLQGAGFALSNELGNVGTDAWTGSYTLRAPEGNYTLAARLNGVEIASTPMTIAAATPQIWNTNFDLGEVRGLVLRDGQPAAFSQILLQEQPPASLSCNPDCMMYMPEYGMCDRCTSNGRFYRCMPQPDPQFPDCQWEQPYQYQTNTGTDGFFTVKVAPAIYKLAVLSSSGGGGPGPMPGPGGPGGGQTGGILVGTFDVTVAACKQTELGFSSAVPVAGGQNQTVSLGDGIDLTFSDVAAGSASYIATSTPPPNEPEPKFQSAGLFYDIIVPAINGPVTLCLPYDAETVSPDDDLHLYHNDAVLGWTDITTSVDTVNHVVCGVTNSFSWFAVGVRTAPTTPLSLTGPTDVIADDTCHGHAMLSAAGGTGTYEWFQGDTSLGSGATIAATLALGTNTVRVVDGSGSATLTVRVSDVTPPAFSVTASPATLWPPNGKLVAITPTPTVHDNCDASPKIAIVRATSTSATPTDIAVDGQTLSLRAFRGGNEIPGRTYSLEYSATDASGNHAIATTTVTVPHDKR